MKICKNFIKAILLCGSLISINLYANDELNNKLDKKDSIKICAVTQLYQALEEIKSVYKESNLNIFYGTATKIYSLVANNLERCDLYLGNDDKFIAKYVESNKAEPSTKVIFAKTSLALLSLTKQFDENCNILKNIKDLKISIPDPKLNVSGYASIEVLKNSKKFDKKVKSKIFYTPNEYVSLSFIINGNTDIGFLPYSLVVENENSKKGSYCIVPKHLYQEELNYYAIKFKDIPKNRIDKINLFESFLIEDPNNMLKNHGFF